MSKQPRGSPSFSLDNSWLPPPSSSTVENQVVSNGRPRSPLDRDKSTKDASTATELDPGSSEDGPPRRYTINPQEAPVERGNRSQRARNSSGFLLQSAADAISQYGYLPTKNEADGDIKGKWKYDAAVDLVSPRRRVFSKRHRMKQVIGGSPLSTELYSSSPGQNADATSGLDREEVLTMPSRKNHDVRSFTNEMTRARPRHLVVSPESSQSPPSVLGYDTDPAQIVNLALNLSESRRRNVSAGTVPPINRRLPSLGQPSLRSPHSNSSIPTNGNLRLQLQQQRHMSRNISARSSRHSEGDAVAISPSPLHERNQQLSKSPIFGSGVNDDNFSASDATLARAERARVSLELSYEYRRLLNHLPTISSLVKNKSTPSQPAVTNGNTIRIDFGMSYNPLQYIRNRKVRIRQRKVLDAEADGWRDVEKIRLWVDAVASEHHHGNLSTSSTLFSSSSSATKDLPFLDTSTTPLISQLPETSATKPKRPRLDWSFNPWELLADAHWLFQDGNAEQIEGPDGNRFIQPQVSSVWTPRSSFENVRRSDSITKQGFTPEKLRSLLSSSRNASQERGRRRNALHESDPAPDGNYSRERKSRWPRNLIRSRSSSSSNESIDDRIYGRPRDYYHADNHDHLVTAPLEKQMRDALKRESEVDALRNVAVSQKVDADKRGYEHSNSEKEIAVDGAPLKNESTSIQLQEKSNHESMPSETRSVPPRAVHNELEAPQVENRPIESEIRTSERMQNSIQKPLAPNQPTSTQRPPSLEMHLQRKGTDQERQAVSERDFGIESEVTKQSTPSGTDISKTQNSLMKERISKHTNGFLSATSADGFRQKFQYTDNVSIKPALEGDEYDLRPKGLPRGGRIADLMVLETHGSGDRLWKKEANNISSRASPATSNYASEESDIETDISGLESSPEDRLSNVVTNHGEFPSSLQKSPESNLSDYKFDNSLNFPSDFSDDGSSHNFSAPVLVDHITRQQMLRRAQGRSSRFDRLAPPRIDIESVSPKTSPPMSRTQTQDTDFSYENSRRSSSSRSSRQAQIADKRLNAALQTPETRGIGPKLLLPSNPSSPESGRRSLSRGLNVDSHRHWSISDQSLSNTQGAVTKRDIARVKALLLSSGVKANEITRRGQEIRDSPMPLLRQLQKSSTKPLPRVPRSQEHLLAAKMLISRIEAAGHRLRDDAEYFSTTTVDYLHDQIRAIDEHVTYKLSPSVRASADHADAFSTELTTTHTLALRQLNDSIDVLLRRRRRRFRWIRRGGYVLLEWILLGLMWWVWLVVVIIKLVKGTIGGGLRWIRWLFWL